MQAPTLAVPGYQLLATLLVGSLRNCRRRGLNLLDQARRANDALAAHTGTGEFVTGQLLRVDLRLGTATIVNAGHPPPLRLRDGVVEEVHLDVDLPFGLEPGRTFQVQTFPWRRAIGSSSSPTGCWDAMPPSSTSPPPSAGRTSCTPAKSSTNSAPRSCAPPAATSATTPPSWSSTGTGAPRDHRDSTRGASQQHASPWLPHSLRVAGQPDPLELPGLP